MDSLDNHSIAKAAEIVFANSSAYVVELPMVGREVESSTLLSALSDEGAPRVVTITAPLGAGKTFFLSAVFGQYARANADFDERRDRREILATDLVTPDDSGLDVTPDTSVDTLSGYIDIERLFRDDGRRQVLVIEEVDRKATLAQIRWSVAAGAAWLKAHPNRVLILTGDATINGRHISEFISGVARRDHIELGPLDVELLKLALRARISEKILKPLGEASGESELQQIATDAATQIVEDDFIRWSAVPVSSPPLLATFREALGILRSYAQNAPSQRGRVDFPRSLLHVLPAYPSGLATRARELESVLLDQVVQQVERDQPVPAFSRDDLAAMIDTRPDAEFDKRVVRLLVRKSLLTPIGIPYEGLDEPSGFSGPFVPSYRMVHNALISVL